MSTEVYTVLADSDTFGASPQTLVDAGRAAGHAHAVVAAHPSATPAAPATAGCGPPTAVG